MAKINNLPDEVVKDSEEVKPQEKSQEPDGIIGKVKSWIFSVMGGFGRKQEAPKNGKKKLGPPNFAPQEPERVLTEEQVLSNYKISYERINSIKEKPTWEDVEARLLASDKHYLKLAMKMQNGGILFGFDKEGNPLIADGGAEPVMKGKNYFETRKAIYGEVEVAAAAHFGYEMFKVGGTYQKGYEINKFEEFTKGPFVESKDMDMYNEYKEEYANRFMRESWVDQGKNPLEKDICTIHFFPSESKPDIWHKIDTDKLSMVLNQAMPDKGIPTRGVRRLLRVKKLPEDFGKEEVQKD